MGWDPRYKNVNMELIGMQHKSRPKKWLVDKMVLAMGVYWSREKRKFHWLDLFACGDFTLMSRGAWFAIQGYLELDLYSLHIDSLGLIAAAALGYQQHVFPPEACTYHISHPNGWETLAPLEKLKFLSDRPALDYGLIMDVGLETLATHIPYNLNPVNWGYADLELEELVFTRASAAAPDRVAIGA